MSKLVPSLHPFLTTELIKKLNSKKIYTVLHFVDADIKLLQAATELTYKQVSTIRKHILNKKSSFIRTGDQILRNLITKHTIISSRIESFDSMLNGGFYTGVIYEICGAPCTGKTQFCYQLAVETAACNKQTAVYFDTKNTFSARRARQFVPPGYNVDEVLSKLIVERPKSIRNLISSMHDVRNGAFNRPRLMVIDSLPELLYKDSKNSEVYNGLLSCLVNVLRFVSAELHVAIVVVNCLTTVYGDTPVTDTQQVKRIPACGKFWNKIANTQLMFSKSGDYYEVTVFKSFDLVKGSVVKLTLNENGFS